MKEALVRLIRVKSVVTIMLTAMFCVLAFRGEVTSEQFVTIFTTVIAFYFGTQTKKEE